MVRDIATVARTLDRALPDLARDVIQQYLDPSDPATGAFLLDPDGREHHQMQWHQWGIITHTRKFAEYLDSKVPCYLEHWGLWEQVDRRLRDRIDGATRWELLHVSVLLHDIGKFGARTRGRVRFHFSRHEELSGRIIRSDLDLERRGLTSNQIEYVARTAEDHFVLGIVRKRAREEGSYDEAFVESARFEKLAVRIRGEYPSDFVEIGVLFLGDSLSKAIPGEGPERAVEQYEINIQVARRYLELVLEQRGAGSRDTGEDRC